jgi:hypothetical protein
MRTENPRVGGSIPPLATIQVRNLRRPWSRLRDPPLPDAAGPLALG